MKVIHARFLPINYNLCDDNDTVHDSPLFIVSAPSGGRRDWARVLSPSNVDQCHEIYALHSRKEFHPSLLTLKFPATSTTFLSEEVKV